MDKKDKFQNWQGSFNRFLGHEFWDDFKDMFKKDDPAMNFYESPSHLLCIISLPGLKTLNDIHVYVDHTSLNIKGNINYDFDGYRLLTDELPQGSFERTIPLPYPVLNKPVQASYERGLLKIKMNRLSHEDEQQLVVIEDRDFSYKND